jgi:uncharacterized Tic20 family protein
MTILEAISLLALILTFGWLLGPLIAVILETL